MAAAVVCVARRFTVVAGVVSLCPVSVVDLWSSVFPVRGSTEELIVEDNALYVRGAASASMATIRYRLPERTGGPSLRIRKLLRPFPDKPPIRP